MEGELTENAVLDYAIFQVSWSSNSYESHICSHGVIEKLASGPLDHLTMHLPEARALKCSPSDDKFKLQLDATIEATWFTKFTVTRFLHVINVPDVLKHADAIENEISQLEEARRFHIALYAKDHSNHFGGVSSDVSYLKDAGLTPQINVETASSDATKNELLRAMDLRLTALKEELAASFSQVAGITCRGQIYDLASFAQHFGAVELSNLLLKLLELCPNCLRNDTAMKQQTSLNGSVEFAAPILSPAKVAQAERQNSSESDDSLDSSDRDSLNGERSRLIVRSATPRRSASPMRRVQIGRSGSRRSTAITIKSLNYIPSKDKTISNGDIDAKESGGDDENNVCRMSVQDAISLFERKQKDENVDIQKRKTSDISVSANKSVLRRWSAGAGGSFNYSAQETVSDPCHEIASSDFHHEADKNENEAADEFSNSKNVVTSIEPVVTSKVVESNENTSATEWNRRQEAELNEMLMKMMESSMDTKFHSAKVGNDVLSDTSMDQRGGFYSQYKEKRDEKLRAENGRNKAVKQAQFKVLHETLEQSKSAMASKTFQTVVKRESANLSQKPRRNSSPPALMKKEVSKPTGTKNISPKLQSPKTGSSLSLGPSKKNGGTPPVKTSPAVSSNSMPSRRRPQASNSPAQQSPSTEKPLEHIKISKGDNSVHLDIKPSLRGQEDKQLKAVAKNRKIVKSRSQLSGEDCGALSKPTFSNKYTKKSTVVPVESKPFLRKGAALCPGIGASVTKAKDTRLLNSDDSSKDSADLVQTEEKEPNAALALSGIQLIEDNHVEPTDMTNQNLAIPLDNFLHIKTTENVDGSFAGTGNSMEKSVEPMVADITHDDNLGIPSAEWVEIEHEDYSPSCNNGVQRVSPRIAPIASSSSRVRHSLSQMLQAENGEPEIIEWGNAENPPSLVYQKDAPKGLKRLLKLARKSKGEGNLTGLSSPSVFSEGEEEHEDNKSSDTYLRKTSLQVKGYGQPRSMVGECSGGGNSSKRDIDCRVFHDVSSGSDKLHGVRISTGATPKSARSFFSLSSFRSSKSNETKPRW